MLYGTFSACTLAVYGTPYEDEVNNFLNKAPPSPSDSKREFLNRVDRYSCRILSWWFMFISVKSDSNHDVKFVFVSSYLSDINLSI